MSKFAILKKYILFIIPAFAFYSCSTSGPAGLFGKKSPHEQYGDKLRDAGLSETGLGRKWFQEAEQSITKPVVVTLPYSESGYFNGEEPRAAGITFKARRGEKITVKVTKKPANGFALFADLWQSKPAPEKPEHIASADTTLSAIDYEMENDGELLVRLQPELLVSGEYKLTIVAGPSLAFPISPKEKANIGSFWGAARDGGSRSHEGIDIFAPRRTPLVAAADGVITRVNENNLGGRVIFLSPSRKNYSLYYAHLEEQLVSPGQSVKMGDTIGLVGNSGNAKSTSPHLHFGIYTRSGAVDPLPFVTSKKENPPKIVVPQDRVGKWARSTRSLKLAGTSNPETTTLDANSLFKIESATSEGFRVRLPNNETGLLQNSSITVVQNPIRSLKVKDSLLVLDQPADMALQKATLITGQPVQVLGAFNDYYYISSNELRGWVPKKAL